MASTIQMIEPRSSRSCNGSVSASYELEHLKHPLRSGHGSLAQAEVSAIAKFLQDLRKRGLSLATCTQDHVDDWLVANP
jgi:hypothetical protein